MGLAERSFVVFYDSAGTHPDNLTNLVGWVTEVRITDIAPHVGQPDRLTNPDVSLLDGLVPRRYWKHDTGSLVEMSAAEKTAWDAATLVISEAEQRATAKADRKSTSIRDRAGDQTIREELNRAFRAIRQLADAIADSTGGVANTRTDVDTFRTVRDITNVTKAEWNAIYDGKVDAIVIDDPNQDPD